MKNLILKTIAASGFMVLLASLSISAQIHGRMAAAIPFDFYVQGQKLSAGEYLISSANPAGGQTALIFAKKDGSENGVIVNLVAADLDRNKLGTQPVLTFNRYGSSFFLSELQNGVDDFAARAPRMNLEKTMSKEFGRPSRENIAIKKGR